MDQFPSKKSEAGAAILAVALGFIGILGAGHLYVGKVRKGLILLFVGLILGLISSLSFIVGFFSLPFLIPYETFLEPIIPSWIVYLVAAAIISGLTYFGLWIWQSFDAYKAAQQYNEELARKASLNKG
jgi:TM2 domain-containing membrane protein YozV